LTEAILIFSHLREHVLAVVVIEVAGVFHEVIVAVSIGGSCGAAASTALVIVIVIEIIVAVSIGGSCGAAASTALVIVIAVVEIGSHYIIDALLYLI
jgi:hypothetical protein